MSERRIGIGFDVDSQALQDLDKAIKTIDNFNRNIDKLKKSAGSISNAFDMMTRSQEQVKQKQQDLNRMMNQFDGVMKGQDATVRNLERSQRALSDQLQKYGRNISVNMQDTGKFTATLTNFDNQVVKVSGSFNEVTGEVEKFRRSVVTNNNAMQKHIEQMKEAKKVTEQMRGTDISNLLPGGREWDAKTDSLVKYGRVISGSIDRNNKFTQTTVNMNGEVVKTTGYYNKARNALVQYNQEISKASKSQLQQAGFSNEALDRMGLMADSMKGMNKYTLSWNEAMQISIARMLQWGSAGTIIYGTQHAFQQMIATIIELDTQLISLKRVLDDDVNMDELFQGAVANAELLGRKLTEINESMIEFGRQGFNASEIETLVKATGMLSNVADMNMTKASENITAYLATFRQEVSDVSSYVDRLNEVDNKYAVSVDQLSDSVRKAGGTANSFGVSIDNVIGYTTAIGEATRESGNVIGNSLKTIMSRVTTIPMAATALDEVGVSVRTLAGDSRNAEDIFNDLSKVWGNLTKAQRENIGVQVAGRYQLNRFMILMQNYDKAMMASETSSKSWGSAQRENQKFMESLQAKINKLWTSLQLLANALGEAGVAKAFGFVIEMATKMVTGITNVVEALDGFTFLLPVATAGLVAVGYQFNVLKRNMDLLNSGLITANPAITNFGTRLGLSTQTATVLSGAIGRVTTSIRAMTVATLSNPLFWIPLAVSAIVGLVGHFDQLEKRQQELIKTTKTANEEYDSFLQSINSGTVDTYELEKYKTQLESLKEEQKALMTTVETSSNALKYSASSYSIVGVSVQNYNKTKEELNTQYANETKAMSVLSDEQENLLTQMGLTIQKETTISQLKEEMTQKQNDYTSSIAKAEEALEQMRANGLAPNTVAYNELNTEIDENLTLMENVIGFSDKLVKELQEQQAVVELLTGVKNRDATQNSILSDTLDRLAVMTGKSRSEIEKNPDVLNKDIEKRKELIEITGKMATGEATNAEIVRAQNLLTAENYEKTTKRSENAVRVAYENKMRKLYEWDDVADGVTTNVKKNLDSEGKKAEENANKHKQSSDKAQKSASDKAKATENARKKVNDDLQKEINRTSIVGDSFRNMADDASSANSKVSSTTKTSKDNTVSSLQRIINKVGDLKIGWGDLAEVFSNPITGLAKLSIKAVFGGLFGAGGNLDGDKLKDSVMKAGGGSISGNGYGGLRMTSGFGYRTHPITGKKKFHAGMDLAGPIGTPIRARRGGTVVSSGWAGGYGNMVTIMGTDGLEYRYAHNSKNYVYPGQFIPAGMTIASMGSTGASTGPHLHFEVRRGGQAINPSAYYHSGGVVDGKRKPNEVDARLQVGEMVINKSQQKNLFDFINKNQLGQGGPTKNYKVQRGDTFSELAEKFFGNAYNGGMDKLRKLNPSIRNINSIFAGQTIKVPDPNYKAPSKSVSKPKPKPTPKPKPRYANAEDAEKFISGKNSWFDQVEELGIRSDSYRVRHMIRPEYREAYDVANKEKEYTNTVVNELKQFTNANEAKGLFDKANVFLSSADKAKAWKVILEDIEQNTLSEVNQLTDTWLENFNSKVKENSRSVQELIDLMGSVEERKIEDHKQANVSSNLSGILSSLGLDFEGEKTDLEKAQEKLEELQSKIQTRAEESAEIQYRMASKQLEPRLKELQSYRDQLIKEMGEIETHFKNRGISDRGVINEAKSPLQERLAEIDAQYKELSDSIKQGNSTLKENESQLKEWAEEYKKTEEELKKLEEQANRREFTDRWGNIVRDAEGNVKLVTDQGQLLMNTYDQIKREMEAVKKLATNGSGLSAVVSPIIDQLAKTVQSYAPTIDTSVTPGTAVVTNNNSSASETRTYQANTNVNRNVTYVVQTGVALASESELREFAQILKDMMDEEEGRSKS